MLHPELFTKPIDNKSQKFPLEMRASGMDAATPKVFASEALQRWNNSHPLPV